MSVPPTRPPSGSSQSGSSDSTDKTDKGKPKKDFKLPGKKEEKEEKKEDEGVFDLSSKKLAEQLKQQETTETKEAATALQTREGVSKIMSLIKSMATQLQVGTVGGKDFASLELKSTADVPTFFQGAQLTLQQTSDGLIIRFDNLQQQAAAIDAVEKNKDQLATMMQNLQDKNIQVAELHLGNHQVPLPKISEPAPVQAPQSVEEGTVDRDKQEREGGEGQQGEQGPSE